MGELMMQGQFLEKVKGTEIEQLLGLIADADLQALPLSLATLVKCRIGGPRWQVSTGMRAGEELETEREKWGTLGTWFEHH